MALSKIKRSLLHLAIKIDTKLKEKISPEGVSYIFEDRKSDDLVIVFTGIGPYSYNYRTSFKNSHLDILFIKDCWADGVSYYLYENAKKHPEEQTTALIERFTSLRKYTKIYTVGSSKGGYAALYYGLKHNATAIYAGAPQYHLGDYLAYHEHPEYYPKVMEGSVTEEGKSILNRRLPEMIDSKKDCATHIHLLYSTKEHTYEDHIVDLINKLDVCGIAHTDYIKDFPQHSMVGEYFKELLKSSL